QAGAAAADFREQRPRAAQRWPPPERLLDGEEDEATLFGLVDDLERDADPPLDAIEQQVDVARLADRAGRRGTDARDVVAVDDFPKAVERGERRLDGAGLDRA